MINQYINELKIITATNNKEKIFLAQRAKENYLFVPKFGHWSDGFYIVYTTVLLDVKIQDILLK